MTTSSKTVLLELERTSVFEQGEQGRGLYVKHPWTKELLEKYKIMIFSDWNHAERYAEEWGVELIRKTEGPRLSVDFLIDADCAKSVDLCNNRSAYRCIEDFFVDQEPGHPVGKRIYLDDARGTPPGWIRAYWPKEVIDHLESGNVTQVSFDNDLGQEILVDGRAPEGYDVIKEIEMRVHTTGFRPPLMFAHTADITARLRMELGIEEIWKAVFRR